MEIMKRNGMEVPFDKTKIELAISKANKSVEESERLTPDEISKIASNVEAYASTFNRALFVEDIQDKVINEIQKCGHFRLAQNYIEYRYKKMMARKANATDDAILSLLELTNESAKQENANKNPTIASTQRDYMAGEVSKDLTTRLLLDPDIVDAHNSGKIHFHDSDYFAQKIFNCCLINLEDMLQNGTVISGTMIEKPHSFYTACNVTTQIVAQVASNQYGGQTFSLAHISPFVEVSRQRKRQEVRNELSGLGNFSDKDINRIAEKRVRDEITRGIQTIQYQLITLMTTNGQAPFVTMYLNVFEAPEGRERDDLILCIEEVLRQRIQGVKNEKGVWITPAFPKLIYALDDESFTTYKDLTELAAKCTAKRMVPDYISLKKMREIKGGDTYSCMGCRSFLTPDRWSDKVGNIAKSKNFEEHKGHIYYSRFNQGVVTINLPYVACESYGDMDKFWEILDERLELCHRALRARHERLLGTLSDVSPIHWQHGALARLEKGEVIDPLLYNGYSTISLGFAGLYETCMRMVGKSHTDPEAKPFALAVMQRLNDKCAEWKAAENIDYSVYGTPMESTTYKFAKALQRDFGMIENVSDHNYITNSYHVCVRENIDAFTKLAFESEFQDLAPGGAISYVEVPNMNHNIPAVLSVMKFICDNIMYAEMNTKSDYCQVCGFEGEIQIVEDPSIKKLIWKCPCCGNTNHDKMNTARRVCGYIGVNDFNQGRMGDVKDRVLHL